MTTRTPMGVPRPPSRTLSNSGLSVQRPAHQRSLSQQYLPPSPIRKETSFLDYSPEGGDGAAAQNRYGATPRRGGSRLKLELSNDSMLAQAAVSESPRTLTPSRIMPHEASDVSDMTLSTVTGRGYNGDAENAPLPMPKRRPRVAVGAIRRSTPASATPVVPRRDNRPKPYTLEIPAASPRYPTGTKADSAAKVDISGSGNDIHKPPKLANADFFPWTGEHPEDHFSDGVIRHGFFDKGPQAQTETTSAKSSLFNALRQKSGLTALSSLYMTVLAQRRHGGQVTAPSTFKPPPRVTLTDTKREIWLKDLANPAITLRRLSRTIPHGIRGKVLLEQCLNKTVPTDRAVWLARCVGANEIRAAKRKGINGTVMGGEAHWIREWTLNVERFVESVVSAFGENDWKAKVTYVIRLSAHLYAEQLLDREHYMDWLVTGLETSSHSRLPIWLLVTQIYWKDLLSLRKYGRRLIATLLFHLQTIHMEQDRDILLQLSSRLVSLLQTLMSSSPENFVAPTTWNRYKDALLAYLPADDHRGRSLYKAIDARNHRLDISQGGSRQSCRQELVKILDAMLQRPLAGDVPTQCWNACVDKSLLVPTLLNWSTSVHRPGPAKVYVGVRLLRAWSEKMDVTGAVLEFLDKTGAQESGRKQQLYQLISELARSNHFSVSNYTRWLIARGGLSSEVEVDVDGPCQTRLLVELPLHNMTDSLRTLRANLLRRAGYSVEEEEQNFEMAIKCVKHAMGLPLDPHDPMVLKQPISTTKLARRIVLSSRALQTEVGSWFQEMFIPDSDDQSMLLDKEGFGLSATTFNFTKTILEAAEDYSMLANFLKSALSTSRADMLASCADTVNVHLQVFAGMGVAADLFKALLERFKAVREDQGINARPLLAALASLAERLPDIESTAEHLRKELIETDRVSTIDACSPLSDNMVAQLQDEDENLREQVEKLRSSTTSVDRQNMDKLFSIIVDHLATCWSKSNDRQRMYSSLLASMRVKDYEHFDMRMGQWLKRVIVTQHRPPLAEFLPLLVTLGCVGLPAVLAIVPLDGASNNTAYLQELLQLLLMPLRSSSGLQAEEICQFAVQQNATQCRNQKELLTLIRGAIVHYTSDRARAQSTVAPLDDDECQARLIETLQLLTISDSSTVADVLAAKPLEPAASSMIARLTTRLLVPDSGDNTEMTFDRVLELANELTLPFCQLKLALGLTIEDASNTDGADAQQSQLELFTRAMDRAIDAKNTMWTNMLPCLSDEITNHLKLRAQTRYLDLFPSAKNSVVDPMSEESALMAESLQSVVEAFVRGRSLPRTTQLTPAMVEKLADLWEILATASGVEERREARSAVLNRWLPLMLSFITSHAASSEPFAGAPTPSGSMAKPPPPIAAVSAAQEIRARLLLVLAGLAQELEGVADPPDDAVARALAQHVLDLALVLVDGLSDEMRVQCARMLLVRHEAGGPAAAVTSTATTSGGPTTVASSPFSVSDPRLRYLFSYAPPPGERFMLYHRERPAGGPGSVRATLEAMYGPVISPAAGGGVERLSGFTFRRWEILNEFTPNVGENDTSLNLKLFDAIKLQ